MSAPPALCLGRMTAGRITVSWSLVKIKIRRASASIPHHRFDCTKLRDLHASQEFREAVERHFTDFPEPTSIEDRWATLRNAITSYMPPMKRMKRKKTQDWFNENN